MADILITGGAGFIGSHLAEDLLNKGHKVFIYDNLSTGSYDNIRHLQKKEGFNFAKADILNEAALNFYIKRSDVVYHLAAAVGVKYILDNPLDSLQTNISGTENILKYADEHGAKVILASTSEVYGKGVELPYSESDDCLIGSTQKTRWGYASAKNLDEHLALAYHKERNLDVVILRFFNTVGPRQTGQYGMVVPTFCEQALNGDDLTVYGDGKQTRTFGHVKDIIRGMQKLADTEEAYGEVFNIGGRAETTINNLAELVIDKSDSDSNIKYIPYEEVYDENFEDIEHRKPDLSKISEYIGYEPKYSLEDIVLDVLLDRR